MENNKMKALVLEEFDREFVMKDLDLPQPASGEVLVAIKASGINPLDLKIKSGKASHAKVSLPAILGIDMAGTVAATGKGVTMFKPGDEVFGMTGGIAGVQGSLAQYASVDQDLIAIKPPNIDFKEAASLPLAFITAWEGLVDRAAISRSKKVLIHGGAGGVGHIAVQLARSFGAEVYATGDVANKKDIEDFGAVFIDYKTQSVSDYVGAFTDGEGFDIVFDTVGGENLDRSFTAVKNYTGHVVSILGWGTHSLAPLSFRGATYSGVFTLLPLITGKGRKHHGEILREASKLVEAGKLRGNTHLGSYRLHEAEAALQMIERGLANGKIVIEID
ncbi:zinc-dependent alcohol dehydrogenase family protein [Flavobacterium sp. MAH-1]|uniref:Zinc-dependent alcohol dehydrogenase family protein n=1 Tax=Flavobacterium agri TaxID=2743471 RepID=A0A7Y8XZC7_9FLAO|nr:zinc-dependent alcohol dehydrogenase family protein [Flavobacterium agri]NUY79628.1 zinc-dependent alcohol dehydrogenase family protein [Flavobacterium agri]NYA69653.1 zinc-dependent alcohol dehydrogenase family protein [Flavobacterium agri]